MFCLFLFGGEVLNGFSFALTVGIIMGSYSTIALASVIVEWWYRTTEQQSKAELQTRCFVSKYAQTAKMFENHGNTGRNVLTVFLTRY